jgi:Arc/MetJ-type ribon-helix-helix transcriptional regulator
MALPEIVIGSKLDAKGFKQAESATDKLTRSVKNLAATLGLAFSTTAIINFGRASVRASLEAQAQQQRLAALLKVTNGATQDQVNVLNAQAASLEKVGVVSGGNVTQVQSQLATFDLQLSTIKALTPAILDYVVAEKGAAASASEFKSMTNGLAQALNGNFASLTRTGFVLDETTKNLIKNGTEAERAAALVTVLNSTYKDFNQNLRDTPMGQFQVLANSAETAKTIIGTDLLAAMKLISGPEGIGGAATAMEDLATQIGNVIYGIGVLTSKIKNIPLLTPIVLTIRDVISAGPLGGLARLGENAKARAAGTPAQSPGQRKAIDKANADALKLQKTKNTLSKIDNDNTTRKLTLTADQLALLELEKKMDVERVGLYAALNQSADNETKMRLLSLIAIKDQNEAMAGMIKKANETGDAFGSLIEAIRASIRAMFDKISADLSQLQALTQTGPNTPIEVQRAVIREKLNLAMPDITALQNRLGQFNGSSINTASNGSPTYIINAQGIGDQQIASVVQGAIQDLNRYGNSTTYAGAI